MVKIVSIPEEALSAIPLEKDESLSTIQLAKQFPSQKRAFSDSESTTSSKRLKSTENGSEDEDKTKDEDSSNHREFDENNNSIWETELPLVNELLSKFTNEENQLEKDKDNSIWEIDVSLTDDLLNTFMDNQVSQFDDALANLAQHYPSSTVEALLMEMETEAQPQKGKHRKPFTEKIKKLSFDPTESIPDAFQFVYMNELDTNGIKKTLESEKFLSILRFNPGYCRHARFFVPHDQHEYDELEYKISTGSLVDKYFFNLPNPEFTRDDLMKVEKARSKAIKWQICATNPNFTATKSSASSTAAMADKFIEQPPLEVPKRKSAIKQPTNITKIKSVEVVDGFTFDLNNIPQALQFKYYDKTDRKKKRPFPLERQYYPRIIKVIPNKGRTDLPRYFVGKRRIDPLIKGNASVDRVTGNIVPNNAPNSITANEFRARYPRITWKEIITGLEGMDYAITDFEYPVQLTVTPAPVPNSQTTAADILFDSSSVVPLSMFKLPTITTSTRENNNEILNWFYSN